MPMTSRAWPPSRPRRQALAPDLVLFGGDYVNMQLVRRRPGAAARGRRAVGADRGHASAASPFSAITITPTASAKSPRPCARTHVTVLDHERQTVAHRRASASTSSACRMPMSMRPQSHALLAGLTPDRPTDRAGARSGVVREGAGRAVPDARRAIPMAARSGCPAIGVAEEFEPGAAALEPRPDRRGRPASLCQRRPRHQRQCRCGSAFRRNSP